MITRHREEVLEALREWFRIHKHGPTLEDLCVEKGMQPRQKATVQRSRCLNPCPPEEFVFFDPLSPGTPIS